MHSPSQCISSFRETLCAGVELRRSNRAQWRRMTVIISQQDMLRSWAWLGSVHGNNVKLSINYVFFTLLGANDWSHRCAVTATSWCWLARSNPINLFRRDMDNDKLVLCKSRHRINSRFHALSHPTSRSHPPLYLFASPSSDEQSVVGHSHSPTSSEARERKRELNHPFELPFRSAFLSH